MLEAVDAGDFQSGGEVGGEIVQQTGFGCGAAHVKAQQLRLAHPLGEPRARMRPGRRPRFHQAHRRKGGILSRDHAAVGEHHQRLPAEAFSLEPLFKLGQIRPDHRHRGGIGGRGAHARKLANLRRYVGRDADRHAEGSAQMLGADSFVVAIHIGMQEADRHRLNSHFPELRSRFVQFFARRRAKHFAPFAGGCQGALVYLHGALAGDGRLGEFNLQVVHVIAMLVANQQGVAEALGGHQPRFGCASFYESIGDERRGVHDRRGDLSRRDIVARDIVARDRGSLLRFLQHSPDASAHGIQRCFWRGEHLLGDDFAVAGVQEHEVGECAPDIHSKPPVGEVLSRRHRGRFLRGRRGAARRCLVSSIRRIRHRR